MPRMGSLVRGFCVLIMRDETVMILDMDDLFSARHRCAIPPEITVRYEAPNWLREFVIRRADEASLSSEAVRDMLCDILLISHNPANWSERFVKDEVESLLKNAEWYQVYDLIEKIHSEISYDRTRRTVFCDKINNAFVDRGVGWQLQNGKIVVRGSEIFQETTKTTIDLAAKTGRTTTAGEMREALNDLSRRPEPDLTGAVTHSIGAFECLARDITNQPNYTLGEWIDKNPGQFPTPLNGAVKKIYGYANLYARHPSEEKLPTYEEAELVVSLSSALSNYLLRKHLF